MSLTSIAPVISATGISVPTYAQVLAYFTEQFQAIYGSDVYLGNDSQDGQWLGIISKAMNDANNVSVSVYNAFNPSTAQGNSLSSNVKLNNLTRETSNYSTVDITIGGTVGTVIASGILLDANGYYWQLPASITIPASGTITETATCTTIGAIQAEINTVGVITTPQLGWQTATNPTAANPGAPVETDAQLRIRQANSVANAASTIIDSILGTIKNLANVTNAVAYNNPTNEIDSNGIPAHSISLVVSGGDITQIATAIMNKKGPGCGTFGTQSLSVNNAYGIPEVINFFVTQPVPVTVNISLTPLTGYTTAIGAEIQNAVSTYINSLTTGMNVKASKLYGPANLTSPDGDTFEITSLTIQGGFPDLSLWFYQQAICSPSNVVLALPLL